jgi:thiamine-phosphate pyrophosphorylase
MLEFREHSSRPLLFAGPSRRTRKRRGSPFLYVIFDGRRGILEKLKGIIKAGADAVQLRDKNLSDRELIELGRKVKKTIKNKALFFINDRFDIALTLSADGIHLGRDDLQADAARKIIKNKLLIGFSTHTAKEIKASISKPVDYISFGPVFKTETKLDALSPRGIKRLKNAVLYSRYPVVAVGGINGENAREVLKTGVNGIAVSKAVLDAGDSCKATREIKARISKYER